MLLKAVRNAGPVMINEGSGQTHVHSHRSVRKDLAFISIIAWIAAISLLSYAFAGAEARLLSLLLVIVLLTLTVIPVLVRYKHPDVAEPIYWISLLYLLYFGVRTVWVHFHPEDLYSAYWGSPPPVSNWIINLTLVYTCAGFIALLAGYYSFLPKLINRSLYRPRLLKGELQGKGRAIVPKIFAIYSIGLLARVVLIARGQAAFLLDPYQDLTLLNIFQLLESFCIYGYALYTIWLLTMPYKRARLIVWLLILAIETAFGFFSGVKGFIIPLFGIPLLLYHYLRKRLSIRQVVRWAVVVVFVLIFLIFPLINSYRVVFYEMAGYSSVDAALSAWSRAHWSFHENQLAATVTESIRSFMNRFSGLDSLSIIVADPKYQRGKTLTIFFIAFIPRFLWSQKPVLDVGRQFAVEYWNQPVNVQNAMAPTTIGELYWNFGLIGVLIGMFLLGVIYRTAYLYFIKGSGHVTAIEAFLYAFIFLKLTSIEGNLATMFVGLLEQLVLLIVITWVMRVKVSP